ncbi:minor tail protein [Arthrobacter phage Lewando]|nr:minor tail protein [Arthrobacter phage Lewando]
MTKVLLQYGSPAPDGSYPPVEGVLIWTPTRRRVVAGMPDKIIMPVGFKVPITGGVITVTVAPSGIDWVWRVDELVKGANRVISYRAVPDADEVEFTELVSVNPTTLSPIAEPEPIWYPWAEALAETAGRAEQSAEDSKLAAIESQGSALASANAAAQSATDASSSRQVAEDKATQAGTSAFNAATSAATALGHKNDAEAAEYSAVAAESNAKLYRDQSQIARGAAESAQLASENARVDTLAARDIAVSANAATVTTGEVDENGHLILTRTDTTPIDAGYVIGPPINLTISDTVTGPETPGIVGPQGPVGPKGDPGPFSAPAWIGTGNLDAMTTSGFYQQVNGAYATLANNYPVALGGYLLVVYRSAGDIVQEYTPQIHPTTGYRVKYIRSIAGSGWTAWRAFPTSRVDQTAGRVIYQWDPVNNREQLIYGDTGWRSIALDSTYGLIAAGNFFGAVNGGVVAESLLQLRRIGNVVYLVGGALQPKQDYSTAARSLCILPSGFRSERDGQHVINRYGNNSGDANQRLVNVMPGASWSNPAAVQIVPLIDANWNNYAAGGTWPRALGGIWVWASWTTSDAWPTSLPGIVSGSIPNL